MQALHLCSLWLLNVTLAVWPKHVYVPKQIWWQHLRFLISYSCINVAFTQAYWNQNTHVSWIVYPQTWFRNTNVTHACIWTCVHKLYINAWTCSRDNWTVLVPACHMQCCTHCSLTCLPVLVYFLFVRAICFDTYLTVSVWFVYNKLVRMFLHPRCMRIIHFTYAFMWYIVCRTLRKQNLIWKIVVFILLTIEKVYLQQNICFCLAKTKSRYVFAIDKNGPPEKAMPGKVIWP